VILKKSTKIAFVKFEKIKTQIAIFIIYV